MDDMKRHLMFAFAVLAFGFAAPAAEEVSFDERLAVFLADVHVNGLDVFVEPERKGKPIKTCMREFFVKTVDEILAMRPRPRYVVVFGDIAYLNGRACDYARSKPQLKRLTDAGIRLTLGLGNHDHRAAFLDAWPEYRERTLLKDHVVTVTEMPDVDLVMLDTLTDNGVAESRNPTKGSLTEAEQKWIVSKLRKWKRPFLVGAHHRLNGDLQVPDKGGKTIPLAEFLRKKCPNYRGFIHGHSHCWMPTPLPDDYLGRPHLTLPSNGCWGDLGYVLFRMTPEKGVASLVAKDFFKRYGLPPEERPVSWSVRVADVAGSHCTFAFDLKPKVGEAGGAGPLRR